MRRPYLSPWKCIFFTGLLALAYYFNAYKIPLAQYTPYNIYPWSSSPQVAKTPPTFLKPHILTALGLLTVAYFRVVLKRTRDVEDANIFHLCFHVVFTIVLIPSLGNFGDFSRATALAINAGLLSALQFALFFLSPEVYFLLLYIPVAFELGMRIVLALTGG